MVKTRQPAQAAIVRVPWRPRDPSTKLEVFRFAEVRHRLLASTERPEFHILILFTKGSCAHQLDFQHLACGPGSLVHVRPGQIQKWDLGTGLDGFILLFEPTFLAPARARGGQLREPLGFDHAAWPSLAQLHKADSAAAQAWFLRIDQACRESLGSPLAGPMLRHLLSAALIDLARRLELSRPTPLLMQARVAAARQFQQDIERSFRVTRNVGDYAARRGCSGRTLDRYAREVLGQSAKELIDARVVLEAKRLLVHTDMTVAAIAENLGFSEATNFVKFFRGRSSESPGAFRAKHSHAG